LHHHHFFFFFSFFFKKGFHKTYRVGLVPEPPVEFAEHPLTVFLVNLELKVPFATVPRVKDHLLHCTPDLQTALLSLASEVHVVTVPYIFFHEKYLLLIGWTMACQRDLLPGLRKGSLLSPIFFGGGGEERRRTCNGTFLMIFFIPL